MAVLSSQCSIPWGARRFFHPVSATALWVVITLGFLQSAQAQSVSGEGPFAANFVGYADNEVEALQIGPGRFVGLTNSILTAMSADNADFLHNQTGRCLGTWSVDENRKTFEQEVSCTYTDADGDQIYESAVFDEQPLDAQHVGTGRWLGGSGKYEGLSGVFEIRTRSLQSAREGLVQYVGTKQGRFSLLAR
ncbi:hypothetical protein EF888_01595 [Silicimonas algicola]|nr:hypothetical protein [Silicimonas algicola]AZQ65934.1 hypothetical protein EF888_01595 [Silicimonas algicola]